MNINREFRMKRNPLGLYDLEISEAGRVIVKERNVSMIRAKSVIEEMMSESAQRGDANDRP